MVSQSKLVASIQKNQYDFDRQFNYQLVRLGIPPQALKRRNHVYFISIFTCIGVASLVATAAYFAILKVQTLRKVASALTPEERLRRAYRSAYFMHVSLRDEVKNGIGGSADAH